MAFRKDNPRLDATGLDLSHLDEADQKLVSDLLSKGVAVPRPGMTWSQVSSAYVRSFHANYQPAKPKAAPTERTDASSADRPIERAAHRAMVAKLDKRHDPYDGGSGVESERVDGRLTEKASRRKMIAANDARSKGDR